MGGVEIGIIGAGWWACQNHIPALRRNPHVAAISVNRPDEAGLRKVAAAFDLPHAFLDAGAMLAARPLAGVIVASPHPLHAQHARLCLERGLPVLIEKPMTTDPCDAAALVDAARRRERTIMVAYGWNFSPLARAARELVRAGWVGEVRHVLCHMATATADLFAGLPPRKTAAHLFQPPPSTWADASAAGGYGWGQLSHALGLVFALVDSDPAGVFAKLGPSPAGVDWHDAAVVTLANGATMTLSGAATLPDSCARQVDLRLFGSAGTLLIDFERQRVEAHRLDGRTHVESLPPGASTYRCIEPVDRFVDACRGIAVDNPADGVVGRRAVQVLAAMYRSAASGRMEAIESLP